MKMKRQRLKIQMSSKNYSARVARLFVATLVCLVACALSALAASPVSDEDDVRNAVTQAFQHLRAGEYDALYEVLPTASQRRLPRERFVQGLGRSRNLYELDRLELGGVHVAGELAVVDSIIYAHAHAPFEAEGKIVARQYLVREDGRWRVTTGERAAINPLLAAHPAFAKQYPPISPRIYLKRDGRWMDINSALKGTRRPTKK